MQRRTTIALAAVAACLLAGSCDRSENEFATSGPAQAVEARTQREKAGKDTLFSHETTAEIEAALVDTYRLRPDRRFVDAMQAVDSILGLESGKFGLQFVDSRWEISTGTTVLGSTRELPGFTELFEVVATYAAQRVPRSAHAFDAAGSAAEYRLHVGSHEALRALRRIEKRMANGHATVGDVRLAAASYATLLLGLADSMEVADRFVSHSLAALAVAEALSSEIPAGRAVLARRLGYELDAGEISRQLPDRHPIRAYCQSNYNSFEQAHSKGDTERSVLLHLDLLSRDGRDEALRQELQAPELDRLQELRVDALRAELEWNPASSWTHIANVLLFLRYEIGRPAVEPTDNSDIGPYGLLTVALKSVAQLLGLLKVEEHELLTFADDSLAELEADTSGALLPGSVLAEYIRGHLLTAFNELSEHTIDRLGSVDSTERLNSLVGDGSSPTSHDVSVFFTALARAERRDLPIAEMAKVLTELERIGPTALNRIVTAAQEQGKTDGHLVKVGRAFARRLDSRVTHRQLLGSLAFSALMDIPLSERHLISASEAAPVEQRWSQLWLANQHRDKDRMIELLNDSATSPSLQRWALQRLGIGGWIEDSFVRGEYERLLAAAPTWAIVRSYAKYLEQMEGHAAAEEVLQQALDNDLKDRGLSRLHALTTVARLRQARGLPEEAWAILAPLLDSGTQYGVALKRGSLIAAELGSRDRALDLARRHLERYESVGSLALLAQVHWHFDEPGAAAELFADPARQPVLSEWRWKIGPAFVTEFKQRSAEEVAEAVLALLAVGKQAQTGNTLTQALYEISNQANLDGYPELALAVLDNLTARGLPKYKIWSQKYARLRDLEGEEFAFKWLTKRMPEARDRLRASIALYRDGHYDLLWTLVPDSPTNRSTDYVWLLRAAAVHKLPLGEQQRQRAKELEEHYSNKPKSYYHTFGQYLTGLIDADTAWAATEGKRDRRTEASYFFAVRALADGEFERAVRWFRLTLETGKTREGEQEWALHQLWRWRGSGKSVETLTREIADGRGRSN